MGRSFSQHSQLCWTLVGLYFKEQDFQLGPTFGCLFGSTSWACAACACAACARTRSWLQLFPLRVQRCQVRCIDLRGKGTSNRSQVAFFRVSCDKTYQKDCNGSRLHCYSHTITSKNRCLISKLVLICFKGKNDMKRWFLPVCMGNSWSYVPLIQFWDI